MNIVYDSSDVEVDDGLAAGDGFEEGEVIGIVVEKVLREGAGAEGVLQDSEVGFPVGVSVGIVFPKLMAGKVEGGGFIEAGGEAVAGGLATGGVAAPAAGVHPLSTVSGSVGVDGDQADILLAQLPAPGVGTLDAGAEGYVVVFRNKEVGIVAGVFQLPDDGGGNLPSVAPFVVTAVRGAFAGGVGAVSVVDQYFHVQVV